MIRTWDRLGIGKGGLDRSRSCRGRLLFGGGCDVMNGNVDVNHDTQGISSLSRRRDR